MAVIQINGKPFEFEEKPWCGASKGLIREDALYVMNTMKDVLNKNGIIFYLNFGTLLGAVREHDFISNDMDIDVAIFEKDVDKLVSLIPELYNIGIKICRYHPGIIYSFIYKGIIYDVDVYRTTKFPYKYRYFSMVSKYFPKFYVNRGSEKIEFAGDLYDVPKDPVKFVEYMYGKNWRIPQKGKHARLFPRWMIHIHIKIFIKRCYRYAMRHFFHRDI